MSVSTSAQSLTYRSVQVLEAGGAFTFVERELPEPQRGQVRLTVEACGVCHSDAGFVDGTYPGLSYPVIMPRFSGTVC